jgi:hypothetical protein
MKRLGVAVLLVVLGVVPAIADTATPVPNSVVTGPVGSAGLWGHPHNESFFSLDPYGYRQDEFFISGTARAYWSPAGPYAPAQYTTRILTARPTQGFNGTVLVEWLNTSTGRDLAGEWLQLHESIMREGYAWVGVSAQPESVTSLVGWDPVRYASLRHGGYPYMFDIYSQAIQAVRSPVGVRPLGDLQVERVIATGVSQSAVRLDEYLDWGPEAEANVIDGYLIERNVDTKRDYAGDHPPVINIASEESTSPVPTTAGPNWRMWQVAGAAHIDHWFTEFWQAQTLKNDNPSARPVAGAETALAADAGKYGAQASPLAAVCGDEGNLYPSRYVSALALRQLDGWVRNGTTAMTVPPLEYLAPVGPSGSTIARDANGNARGGFRSPVLDVPVMTYLGNTCGLSGNTLELAPGTLAARFPTHTAYVSAMSASVQAAVAAGTLLPEDATDLMARVQTAAVPR